MKQTLLVAIFCLVGNALFAQRTGTVKGQVTVESDGQPLSYVTASVAVTDKPDASVKKFATDEKGNFSVSLPAGKYLITFQFMGMDNRTVPVEITGESPIVDLGKIEMTESSVELGEVSVTAQRPLVKVDIDKLTYNVKEDPEAPTSSVLDLLRKVPLVTVDAEDKIQVKGSSSFKIYLNGKPSNMVTNNPSQVLKSMPANSIKDIEVITDPGAKYDAEGVSGIINIITDKRVDDGYSGSVGANADTNKGYGGNTFLTLKYGKFGFSGNAGYNHHARPASESSFEREDRSPNPENMLTQKSSAKSDGNGLYLDGSISFEPDTMNLFNLSASRYGGTFNSLSDQVARSTGARTYSYDLHSRSVSEYGGINLSADYQRSFKKKGEMLTMSYRFEKNPSGSEYESEYNHVEGDFYEGNGRKLEDGYRLKSVNDPRGTEHTAQIDYVNPLHPKHELEAGLKYIFRDNISRGEYTYYDVQNAAWFDDPSRKNDLDHGQRIASGYAGYFFKTGKIGIKTGLRGEYTDQNIHFMSAKNDTTVQTHFFDLVPTLTFSYQLGMTQTVRLGYNMRISRPGIWVLNPYVNDANPSDISYGNPDLDSEQSHNFNINYGSFSQKINFNATLSYTYTNNSISSYSFVKDGVTNNTYANIGKNQYVGLNVYGSWSPSQLLRAYLNGNIGYTDLQSNENNSLRNSGISGQAFTGLTFTFPKEFRLSANGGVFSSNVELQTTQSAYYFYSLNATKSFFDKKLDIGLSANNIFGKYLRLNSTTEGEGFRQKSIYNIPMRTLRLSITYRFGDLKTSIKKVNRTISNDDVKGGESSQGQGNVPASGSN